jgi:polygalacturonase
MIRIEESATTVLQRKIDAAAARGGGTVVVPEGEHVCGTLYLKSGVRLHLEHGARIFGSTDLEDYPLHTEPSVRCFADWNGMRSLIYAESADRVALTGSGVIDGRGAAFESDGTDKDGRPRLIQMVDCRDVLIEGLHLRNSGLWLQHYLGCERLRVTGLTAWNHVRPNNDFIDVEGCRDVRISDCSSDTDDDGITLKSGCERPTEDVVISNCVIRSHCNAIKCGTESNGGFRNISISNCVIAPSRSESLIHGWKQGICGIALETVDGGFLENLTVSNIAIRGTAAPFFLRLGSRCRSFLENGESGRPGKLRQVSISHVEVQEAGPIGCLISGIPGHPVEDIQFCNIRIQLAEPAPQPRDIGSVPEKEDSYPEATQFGHLPAAGFFVRHARGVRFDSVEVIPHPDDPRAILASLDAGLDAEIGFPGQPHRLRTCSE